MSMCRSKVRAPLAYAIVIERGPVAVLVRREADRVVRIPPGQEVDLVELRSAFSLG